MVLCEPGQESGGHRPVQGQLIGYHPPEELYLRKIPPAALTLVEAGLGFTLLPDVAAMRHPRLIYVPVEDAGCSPTACIINR